MNAEKSPEGPISMLVLNPTNNSQNDAKNNDTQVEIEETLKNKIKNQKKVPIIIEFTSPDSPFDPTSTTQLLRSRKQTISSLRTQLLNTLNLEKEVNIKTYDYFPFIALNVDETELEALRKNSLVVGIYEDGVNAPQLDDTIPLIGADIVQDLGFDGSGEYIAIIDSGVDTQHPFFGGRVVEGACFSTNNSFSGISSLCPNGVGSVTSRDSGFSVNVGQDCTSRARQIGNNDLSACEHGTHVAGIAAGSNSRLKGVAPKANIISIQVFSSYDSPDCLKFGSPRPCVLASDSDLVRGFDYVLQLKEKHGLNIASANMSIGGGQYHDRESCIERNKSMNRTLATVRAAGIAATISAGNSHSGDSVTFPSCLPSAISVGSTTKSNPGSISSFSNISPFVSILAPGSSVLSSIPGNSSFGVKSGTSMAAPHVAGAWAIIKSVLGDDVSVDQVESILQRTGVPITDDRSVGKGTVKRRIDLAKAIEAAQEIVAGENLNCSTIMASHPESRSGAYDLTLPNGKLLHTYCDMDSNGGGWTLIGQRSQIGRKATAEEGSDLQTNFSMKEVDASLLVGEGRNFEILYVTNNGSTVVFGPESSDHTCFRLSGTGTSGDFLKVDFDGNRKTRIGKKNYKVGNVVAWGHMSTCAETTAYGFGLKAVKEHKDGFKTGLNEKDGIVSGRKEPAANAFARLFMRPRTGQFLMNQAVLNLSDANDEEEKVLEDEENSEDPEDEIKEQPLTIGKRYYEECHSLQDGVQQCQNGDRPIFKLSADDGKENQKEQEFDIREQPLPDFAKEQQENYPDLI
ncbi:MAG: S8 family serine peptidase, partial [Pseudomonadales bacterium]|nr:S8 family serine peptidase [Pseudomonadales bacterium]